MGVEMVSVATGGSSSAADDAGLPDEVLLQICEVRDDDFDEMPDSLDDLRAVPILLASDARYVRHHVELGITQLAHGLGQVRRFNPIHLPFGYSGPQVHSCHWVKRDTLARIAKQIMGLVQSDRSPESVAVEIDEATSRCVQLGFLDHQDYDAWRPGMPSGSGWRVAVRATPYGLLKARSASRPDVDRPVTGPHGTMPAKPRPASAPVQEICEPIASTPLEPFTWARQTDLVNAVNQVLGQGMLNKGVLSRACRMGKLTTNGKPGQASRVQVPTFLKWVARHFSLGTQEQTQVRNAIIGEITSRNS